MNRNISAFQARELIEELLRRMSATEACRRIGIAVSTESELRQLADDLDDARD